jgi:poly(hydroxyalkanoate) depolymerase family esterase
MRAYDLIKFLCQKLGLMALAMALFFSVPARAELFSVPGNLDLLASTETSLQSLGTESRYEGLPGKWIHGSFMNFSGLRDYYFYMPANHAPGPIPLVVILHGCSQDAPGIAAGSGMNELAEADGFAVLYPNQSALANPYNCWNWYLPVNQMRDVGEPSIVVGMIGQISALIPLDQSRIFIGGISAGGAMTSNMIACYADLFTGGAIMSGLEFRAATSAPEAFQVAKTGPTQELQQSGIDAAACTGSAGHVQAILVIHGSSDTAVNPINSDRTWRQMTYMNDVLDDGSSNYSQTVDRIDSQPGQVPGGYAYTMDSYGGAIGGVTKIHIMNVTVDGMGHAWSGAKTTGTYLDPKGPDAGLMMWQFLSHFAGT